MSTILSRAATRCEIQVNIILANKSQCTQTQCMVGFVMIHDAEMKLSNLRVKISQELDDEQFKLIGLNFKFLKRNFPVSAKQETAIQISSISVIPLSTNTHISDIPSKLSTIHDTTDESSASTKIISKHRNGLIEKEQNDITINRKKQITNNMKVDVFNSTPHHHQYRSTQSKQIPFIPVDKKQSAKNTKTLPKCKTIPAVSLTQNIPNFMEEKKIFEYTVLIRTGDKSFPQTVSGINDPQNKEAPPVSLVSLFVPLNNDTFDSKHNDEKDDIASLDINPALTRKSLEGIVPTTPNPTAVTTHFIASCPLSKYSPKSTRLEAQIGEKLPRIRPEATNQIELISKEVDSILKNAIVTQNTGYVSMDEDDPYEASFTLSADELHPLKSSHAASHTSAQLIWCNTQRQRTIHHINIDDRLSDENIKCKLTVIGTPIEDLNERNMMWEFENATDLIKGLGGVAHNNNNPLWIDMICDRNTFINITEHIRPSIHTLTIEDCLTMDCREKLEIFNEYLFVCLKTWHDTDQTITHSINILIFRTMIITYHLGHNVTNNVMAECRYILTKKFGNMCPSPAWVGHTIMDHVVDRMMPEVESRVCEVETCEQFVFKLCNESQNELLHRMQNVRSWMVLYRSRLWPKSTITQNLLNNSLWEKDFLCDVPLPYWRDINDHVARMVDLLELGTHTLESIQNIFVAKVSLEMTQQSNNLATSGGKLANVGAVFLPLTVICGIWGMNCRVPFQFNPDGDAFFDDNLLGFIVVLLIMLFSSIFTWKFVNKFS